MSLLKVESLSKTFASGGMWSGTRKLTHAVNQVSFDLARGETLAIVGESGSGKSTTARMVMRLLDADAGRISLLGEDISRLRGRALRRKRRHMQMVFQDPFASLNPRMKITESVGEGLRVHAPQLNAAERRNRVAEILAQCGMDSSVMDRYPHQFSGGQRQRIGIARALAVSPELLVLDEPVSALDVSVQAQILNLLADLQAEHQLSYLFISHDLSVVRHVADRVAVMFAGHIVEQGDVEAVYAHPRHPYTRALLDARPAVQPAERRGYTNETAAADMDITPMVVQVDGTPAIGCPYRHRCAYARNECASARLQLESVQYPGEAAGTDSRTHTVACLVPLGSDATDTAQTPSG